METTAALSIVRVIQNIAREVQRLHWPRQLDSSPRCPSGWPQSQFVGAFALGTSCQIDGTSRDGVIPRFGCPTAIQSPTNPPFLTTWQELVSTAELYVIGFCPMPWKSLTVNPLVS